MKFPDDENGDVLRRLLEDGADFSVPHKVNYEVVFSNEMNTAKFGRMVTDQGYTIEVILDPLSNEYMCVCTVSQMLDYEEITNTELLLSKLSSPLEGEVVGWGTFS